MAIQSTLGFALQSKILAAKQTGGSFFQPRRLPANRLPCRFPEADALAITFRALRREKNGSSESVPHADDKEVRLCRR
jgi:hypothetical protein